MKPANSSDNEMSDEEFAAREVWRKQAVAARQARFAAVVRRSCKESENGQQWIKRSICPEARPIKDSVKKFIKKSGLKQVENNQHLTEIWYNTIGAELAQYTVPVSFRNGVCVIEVFSPALRQELDGFYKQELLESMREALPEVTLREIRFKLGTR